MRLSSLLTSFRVVMTLQLIVTIWFLADYILARDSMTANQLKSRAQIRPSIDKEIQHKVELVRAIHCVDSIYTQPQFDKLVLVIIDALGSEFIPNLIKPSAQDVHPKMPFVEKLLIQGNAMGFVAKAATPTVTMPRIKSIISGTIPSFLDVMYNFLPGNNKFQDDNLVSIAKARNKSIVYYGDDTWLALFDRNTFIRHKETFSFFAQDYTTVDTNVTEKALPEITKPSIDWDLLILHYLGLDHIGHVYGTNVHPLLNDKLKEMDDVIEKIFINLANKPHKTLLVVCGDHGMNQKGNHGGNSKLESETALMFIPINRHFESKRSVADRNLKQVDISTTISVLLGFPTPQLSKGVAIEPILRSLTNISEAEVACIGLTNLLGLIAQVGGQSELDALQAQLGVSNLLDQHLNSSPEDATNLSAKYFGLSRRAQSQLLETMISDSMPTYLMASLCIVTLLSLILLRSLLIKVLFPLFPAPQKLVFALIFLTPILCLGSTDFLEAEHYYWAFFAITSLIVGFGSKYHKLGINDANNADRLPWILMFASCLVVNSWYLFDLHHLINVNSIIKIIAELVAMKLLIDATRKNMEIDVRIPYSLAGMISLIHWLEGLSHRDYQSLTAVVQLITLAFVILFIAVSLRQSIIRSHGRYALATDELGSSTAHIAKFMLRLSTGWLWLMFLVARESNYVFFMANLVLESNVNRASKLSQMPLATKALLYYMLSQSAFYSQGNTNLFSSLDVKPAFFGQTTFSLPTAVPLVLIGAYSSQIYWLLKMIQRIISSSDDRQLYQYTLAQGKSVDTNSMATVKNNSKLIVLRMALSLNYYMFVCFLLKDHLFVWSVISPKLIYHVVNNFVATSIILLVIKVVDMLSAH